MIWVKKMLANSAMCVCGSNREFQIKVTKKKGNALFSMWNILVGNYSNAIKEGKKKHASPYRLLRNRQENKRQSANALTHTSSLVINNSNQEMAITNIHLFRENKRLKIKR